MASYTFTVECWDTLPGQAVYVVGSAPELGAWKVPEGVRCSTTAETFPIWKGEVVMNATEPVELKIVIADEENAMNPVWEHGCNKTMQPPAGGKVTAITTFYSKDILLEAVQLPNLLLKNVQAKADCSLADKEIQGEAPQQSAGDGPEPKKIVNKAVTEEALDDTFKNKVLGQATFRMLPSVGTWMVPSPVTPARMVNKTVPQTVLDDTFKNKVLGHSHGMLAEGQKPWAERPVIVHGHVPIEFAVSCQKGKKGLKENQDNYSVTHFKSGYTLVCTFDGHGEFGHIVSTRTVQTVPWFLVNDSGFDSETIDEACIEEALINAFEKAHKDVVALASLEKGWDVEASGSTAVAVLFNGAKVWTANAGDSRCVIGSVTDEKVIFATEDHKPESEQEKTRIESMGGEVRSITYDDGLATNRIYIKGKDSPGLGMARTLGDQAVKDHGVIPTPEVRKTVVDLGKKVFFIAASDGLWEFMDSQFVVEAVAMEIEADGLELMLKKLHCNARQEWKEHDGGRYDDITSVLVRLS